jgi:hypothetical protein
VAPPPSFCCCEARLQVDKYRQNLSKVTKNVDIPLPVRFFFPSAFALCPAPASPSLRFRSHPLATRLSLSPEACPDESRCHLGSSVLLTAFFSSLEACPDESRCHLGSSVLLTAFFSSLHGRLYLSTSRVDYQRKRVTPQRSQRGEKSTAQEKRERVGERRKEKSDKGKS